MAQEPVSQLPARPRPVAELSMDQLIERADELAQRWAVALILARPLEGIGGVPVEDVAREGPALCAQTLRALGSDAALDRLTGAGTPTGREQSAPARRLGAIAGAEDAVGTIAAVEALRGVLWETLLEEIRLPPAERSASRRLGELSDRLAHVCACATVASVAAHEPPSDARAGERSEAGGTSVAADSASGEGGESSRSRAVLVDERVGLAPTPARAPRSQGERPSAGESLSPSPAAAESERSRSRDQPAPLAPGAPDAEIEIRDERGEEGPAAWIGSIGGQLERYRQDGVAFAVLLVEPVEIDRLRGVESAAELQRVSAELEEALKAAWPGSITRQRAGRYWLLALATNRQGARDLAERLREDVAHRVMYRRAPLVLAVGTAVCPQDGEEASALAAHADVGLYAARSAARAAAVRIDEPAQP